MDFLLPPQSIISVYIEFVNIVIEFVGKEEEDYNPICQMQIYTKSDITNNE